MCVLSNLTVSVSNASKFGLIVSPCLVPCTARMSKIVPYWSSPYSILGLSVERLRTSKPILHVPNFEFAQHLLWESKHVSIVLLRPLHDNLCVGNFFLWNAWKCLRIHIFFSVLLFADTNRHELWLWRSFLPSCWMSPCVCARNRPQIDDCGENTAPEFLCSISLRISCRACCSNPRDKRTQDFKILACRDGTCTSVTRVPADSKTSIPVTGPIVKNCL